MSDSKSAQGEEGRPFRYRFGPFHAACERVRRRIERAQNGQQASVLTHLEACMAFAEITCTGAAFAYSISHGYLDDKIPAGVFVQHIQDAEWERLPLGHTLILPAGLLARLATHRHVTCSRPALRHNEASQSALISLIEVSNRLQDAWYSFQTEFAWEKWCQKMPSGSPDFSENVPLSEALRLYCDASADAAFGRRFSKKLREMARAFSSIWRCCPDQLCDEFRLEVRSLRHEMGLPGTPEDEVPDADLYEEDEEQAPGELSASREARALEPAETWCKLPEWVGEHFQRNQWKLLRRLWGRGEVPIQEVYKAIYGNRPHHEEALDKVKDRVNRRLAEVGQPFEVVARRGEVYILRRVG